jgi:3-oxoacyl-[acyl-carrier-protein] synthase II
MRDKVVITGSGLLCALGHTLAEVWSALLAGVSGIRPIEGFPVAGLACRVAAQVRGLSHIDLGVAPRLAGMLMPHTALLLQASRDALEQSRAGAPAVAEESIGFFAGMGMVDYAVEDLLPAVVKSMDADGCLNYDWFYTRGYQEIYPLWPLAMLNNIAFCQVATTLDLRGENAVFSPHADAGAQAVVEGVTAILEERAQLALAGGVGEQVSPLSLVRARCAGLLPTAAETDPVGCRPFGLESGGTVLGEGCAMLALERHASAQARGARCRASVAGWGFACEVAPACPGPTANAIAWAMQGALEKAGKSPADIDVLLAHGDGTPHADRQEIRAIVRTFGDHPDKLRVFASKGALGHLLAAAPAADVVLGMQMIESQMVPATFGALPPGPAVRFNLVTGQPVAARVQTVMVNACSHAGSCASLVIEALA